MKNHSLPTGIANQEILLILAAILTFQMIIISRGLCGSWLNREIGSSWICSPCIINDTTMNVTKPLSIFVPVAYTGLLQSKYIFFCYSSWRLLALTVVAKSSFSGSCRRSGLATVFLHCSIFHCIFLLDCMFMHKLKYKFDNGKLMPFTYILRSIAGHVWWTHGIFVSC